MYRYFKIFSITFISLFLFSTFPAYSGGSSFELEFPETDTSEDKLLAFFDLRDRETYIQITNTGNDLNPSNLDDDDGSRSGSAYTSRFNGARWVDEQKFTASDANTGDYFGVSVAVTGTTAVVGAYLDDDRGIDSGSAYVYELEP